MLMENDRDYVDGSNLQMYACINLAANNVSFVR